jgi:hypothetical protein
MVPSFPNERETITERSRQAWQNFSLSVIVLRENRPKEE